MTITREASNEVKAPSRRKSVPPRAVTRSTKSPRVDAFYFFYKAYKLVYERIERDLTVNQQVALSPLEMMHRIGESPEGRLRLLDLAHSLVTSPSSVTRIMDKLVRQGFIVRRESEQDRRETFASLTPKGKQALDNGMKILRKSIEQHFEFAFESEEDTATFLRILHVLTEGK